MCFSATASFIAFGVTGVTGLAAVARIRRLKELPLAAIPLVFASQQGIEGMLWLTLPVAPQGPASSLFTHLFIILAKVLWPVYAPLAILMVEPDRRRQRLLAVCLAAGAGAAVYFLGSIFSSPHSAFILNSHVVYSSEPNLPVVISLLYLAATGFAPILSSQRVVVLFGAVVLLGSIITYLFYWEAYTSVWCFFAAAGSVVILAHFERARRAHQSAVRA
ncbi:MAG: hypothetical protein OEM91_04450 [Hyphomicrobiales bacterium]|nr:hypothetical protein [Hyphomicrobiales bacterium]